MKVVQAGILAVAASAIAVVLWHAAVQARRVGYGQVVAVEFQSMEDGGYETAGGVTSRQATNERLRIAGGV